MGRNVIMIHVALMGEIVMSLHHPRLRLVSKAIQRLTAPKDLPMEFVIQNVIPMLVDWMEEIVNRQHHQMLTYLPLTHTYHHQVNQNMAVENTKKNYNLYEY